MKKKIKNETHGGFFLISFDDNIIMHKSDVDIVKMEAISFR